MELKKLSITDIERIGVNQAQDFILPDAFALNSARNLVYYVRQTRGWTLKSSTDYNKHTITITRLA